MHVGDADFERAVKLTIEELRRLARTAARLEDCRITYKQLSEFLAQHGLDVPYHSDLMSQLLAEASRREDGEGRGMISALVVTVNYGAPMVPGAGFYRFARQPPFNRAGEQMEIWLTEIRRVFAENRPTPQSPTRTITRENLGAWLVKCNPHIWDFDTFRHGDEPLENWSVQPSYRADLIEAGQRVLLWVTGRDGTVPEPGLWGAGFATGPVYEGEPETGDPLWLDEEQRDRSSLFMPFTMQIWNEPIARRDLQVDPRLADMEIFRQPQMSNPLWLSTDEFDALRAHVELPDLHVAVNDRGAGFGDTPSRKAVEQAAMDAVTQYYAGWSVKDVSRERCGWDLTCESARGEIHHVEVKGVSGSMPIILLTRNEERAARENDAWRLAVVTRALIDPHVRIVDGAAALTASEPFAFTVNLTHV